jgi:4-amino-4-deoxy-L-arabinose transferase-like glycosyltransferase
VTGPSVPSLPTRTHVGAALLVILLLASGLRVLALSKPFYVDEITTLTVASQPLDSMAQVMRKIDASPALYPLALHGWLKIARDDAWARLLSAVFGVAAVWAVFGLGRALFGARTGLAAAFVVAIGPIHVEYAQYVRSYSLFTCLAILQLWAFARCLLPCWSDDRRTVRPFALLALATAAIFYTHYLSLLVLAPEGLYALWRLREAPGRVLRTGGAIAVAAVLFAPGVPLLRHNLEFDAQRNAERAQAPPAHKVLSDLFGELALGRRDLGFSRPAVRRTALAIGAFVFPALFMAGILAGWRQHREATILALLFAVLPILIYVASGRRLVAVRFFLPFGAVWLLLVAHGLASFARRRMAVIAPVLALLCAVPIAHFVSSFRWSYDHRVVARAIAARWEPGDIILFVHPFESFHYRWYLGAERPLMGLTFTPLVEQATYVIKPDPLVVDLAKNRVLNAARAHDRLWIVGQSPRSFSSRDAAQEAELLAWMEARFGRVDDLGALTGNDPVVRLFRGRQALDAPAVPAEKWP